MVASLRARLGGHDAVGAALVPGAPAVDTDASSAVRDVMIPDELVTRARQTGAQITFVEDPTRLAAVGGVGAMLRYRV